MPGEPRAAVALRPLVPGMRRLLFTAAALVLLAGIQLFVFTGHTSHFLLAVLLFIALARYPHQFAWRSPSGIAYLIFLVTMLLTGAVGLARGMPRRPAHLRPDRLPPGRPREKQDNLPVSLQADSRPHPSSPRS